MLKGGKYKIDNLPILLHVHDLKPGGAREILFVLFYGYYGQAWDLEELAQVSHVVLS